MSVSIVKKYDLQLGRVRQATFGIVWAERLLVGMFLLEFLPETIFEVPDIRLGSHEIPLQVAFFWGAMGCVFAHVLVSGHSRWTPAFLITGSVGLYMAANGWLSGAEFKFFVVDFSTFAGILLGIWWGANCNPKEVLRQFRKLFFLALGFLLFNTFGILCGLIPPAHFGLRLYTYSIFNCAGVVATLFPIVFYTESEQPNTLRSVFLRLLQKIGLAGLLFSAIATVSRAIFLSAVVSGILTMWIGLHGKVVKICVMALTIVVGTLVLVEDGRLIQDGYLAERMTMTPLEEEARYVEVQMMFEDLRGALIFGRGFGSRFVSCIGFNEDALVLAPHVAVLTSLYKGGVVAFFVLMVIPGLIGFRNLLLRSRNAVQAALGAAVLLYLVQSSMSGGWWFSHLFLYGTCFSLAMKMVGVQREGIQRCRS